jgi:hypothetical protein
MLCPGACLLRSPTSPIRITCNAAVYLSFMKKNCNRNKLGRGQTPFIGGKDGSFRAPLMASRTAFGIACGTVVEPTALPR